MIMSTQAVSCPSGVWTQVTSSSVSGVIIVRTGRVVLTEQSSEPSGDASSVAWSASLTGAGDGGSYANVASGDFVWAYSTSEDSILDVTPIGGVL